MTAENLERVLTRLPTLLLLTFAVLIAAGVLGSVWIGAIIGWLLGDMIWGPAGCRS